MFNAFIDYAYEQGGTEVPYPTYRFFTDNYSVDFAEGTELQTAYEELVSSIKYIIRLYLSRDTIELQNISDRDKIIIPDWVYAYMLKTVICNTSDELDRHGYLVLMGMDNIEDIMTGQVYEKAYSISKKYSEHYMYVLNEDKTLSLVQAPPTMFGDAEVIKILRIQQESL